MKLKFNSIFAVLALSSFASVVAAQNAAVVPPMGAVEKAPVEQTKAEKAEATSEKSNVEKAGALPQEKINAITSNIEKSFGVKVLEVNATPYTGLYEVLTNETIVYTDADSSFILAGHLFDTKTTDNLTQQRVKEQSAKAFAKLPVGEAVKRVKGKGTRKLVTFEDPNCRYCKALYKELEQMDDVTIYTFLVPILAKDSVTKVRDIMCSSNPALAWHEWVEKGQKPAPQSKANCEEPNPKTLDLARSVDVRGVPVILFPNGERRNGFVRLSEIEEIISQK
ncbi:putative disulphide bond isomerase [Taylorella asinigenitalis 14/45]|uniref:Thiol:disulfide interchange protein n=1 Tax=Taylorella asinigenitalis 14/45 TaxID=1091495 RepID=I7IC92_9BURK|nr:DsbC family protein [Taylorella asinigenitalis]CCG20151.1 putative disulphide bond isomerase [Taylorella asinigenitalis 14/45]